MLPMTSFTGAPRDEHHARQNLPLSVIDCDTELALSPIARATISRRGHGRLPLAITAGLRRCWSQASTSAQTQASPQGGEARVFANVGTLLAGVLAAFERMKNDSATIF